MSYDRYDIRHYHMTPGIATITAMTTYSITQKSRGGNVTAAATRRAIGDCYRRISEGNGTPNDVKTALADAKREYKRMRAELATLGIDASIVTADELQQHIDDADAVGFSEDGPRTDERKAARQRFFQLEQLAGVIWFRDFIAEHK